MATRVTDGARRERHASPLQRAYIALTKSEEKERLLAIYWVKGGVGGQFQKPKMIVFFFRSSFSPHDLLLLINLI